MGWSSGSSLFSDIIDAVVECEIDDETRKMLYEKLIPVFEDEDCDTLDECVGKDSMFDSVFHTLYPTDNDDDFLNFDDEDGC